MLQKVKTLVIVLISTITLVFAQEKGKIAGKVEDAGTSEELIGVAVGVKGSSFGATTDIEGHYLLSLEPGVYTLVISYMGYNTKEITEVEVKAGQTTDLKITLEEASLTTEEVVITATFKKESVDALLLERKNAVSVSDGVSADLIKKTPDRTTADVLKRISGATIQDNKFAVIRGLNERYNAAFINNAPLPSSEPDRKAFALDIFPSNIVESMSIFKTATPDLPGDFAGGVIKIKTRDIPDETFYSLSIGANANSISTFKEGLTYKGGKADWLGLDDGTRSLSKNVPDKKAFEPDNSGITSEAQKNDRLNASSLEVRDAAKTFSNNWGLNKVSSLSPGTNFQFTTGQKIKNLGIIFSISHNRNVRHVEGGIADFNLSGVKENEYKDQTYNESILWGGIANISYKIHDNHKLSLKNTYNINSQDQVVYREGADMTSNNQFRINNTAFTQNRLNSHQIGGDHFFKRSKLKFDWTAGLSSIKRVVPDYKVMTYSRTITDPDSVKYRVALDISDPRVAGRFFSTMDETVKSGGFDISRALPTVSIIKSEVKAGIYLQERERTFTARQFVFSRHRGFDKKYTKHQQDSLESLGADQIFAPQNFDYEYNSEDPTLKKITDDEGNTYFVDVNGNKVSQKETWSGTYSMQETTTKSSSYKSSSSLRAFYFMMDHRISTFARLTWGGRLESFNQKLNSVIEAENRDIKLNTTKSDWLPSVNLTLSPYKKLNVRLAYYKTLNRPEFRELAPFKFYDFVINRSIQGNDSLARAIIHNYDARVEFFPGAGQVLSATFFNKEFINPIERYLIPEGGQIIVYDNAKSANLKGIELEARQNLQVILPSNTYLKRITVSANYSRMWSSVKPKEKYASFTEKNRPLQGQSDYIVNAAISYDNEEKGFGFNFAINRVGKRLAYIGNTTNEFSIWENPRTMLDLQISKTFLKKKQLEAKLNVSDLLGQKQIFYQDADGNKRYNAEKDYVMYKYRYGTTASFSLTYKF